MSMKFVKSILLLCLSWQLNAAPAIQEWTTENGAHVLFVSAPELPMVDVRVVFDAGAAREGDQWGLASLTSAVLSEGAGGISAEELSERFDEVGAQFGRGSLADMAYVSVRSITDPAKLQPALDNLTIILTQPDFPQQAIDRQKNRTLVGLEQKKQSPAAIAEEAFMKALYGDHPYAHPSSGTKETVTALGREDILGFYQKWYTSENATVAIVGDVNTEQAKAIAEKIVSRLPRGHRAPPLPDVEPLTEAKVIKIPYPSTQTHIRFGQPGMKRGDPDYFALYAGNHSLGGGGLVSRLSNEVREKRGLSYSVYSYFMPMAKEGPFIAGLQTKNERAEEAINVLQETIKSYVEAGQTEEEFSASIKNITGGFPLRIDSNGKIVEYLSMIGFYKLPLDYLDTFMEKIENLNLQRTREAMERRLDPAKMVTVIVGGSIKEDP